MLGDILLFGALLVAAYTDYRRGKIYNWLTLPLIGAGLFGHLTLSGLPGLGYSLLGTLAGGTIFLLPFLLGGMGAGDVKLLAAIGALQGAHFALECGLYAGMAGGVYAVLLLLQRGKLGPVVSRLYLDFRALRVRRVASETGRMPVVSQVFAPTIPYGIPIAIGALLARCL